MTRGRKTLLKDAMTDTRSLEDLRHAGAGRPSPEAVARLYTEAFARFGIAMLWSRRQLPHPTITQALAIAEALRFEGNMQSRPLAVQLEEACRAAV